MSDAKLCSTVALARRGRSLDGFDDAVDELADEQPALASGYGASAGDRQLPGASPGEQTRKLVHPVRELASPDEALAEVGGVNVHVGPAIDGRDRERRERLCRYLARPPVCQERLAVTESGHVVVHFNNAWRNGAHAVVLEALDFVCATGRRHVLLELWWADASGRDRRHSRRRRAGARQRRPRASTATAPTASSARPARTRSRRLSNATATPGVRDRDSRALARRRLPNPSSGMPEPNFAHVELPPPGPAHNTQ